VYFDSCRRYVSSLSIASTDSNGCRTVVVVYTAVGGLKATFLTDFLHTTIALILLIYFSLAVLTNKHIGGISGLYEKVKAADDYIPGNYEGSLLSMKSKSSKIDPSRYVEPC
jgi:Na+/proline symporter